MEWYWILSITIILTFCFLLTYLVGFSRGFRKGVRRVIAEWKETLKLEDDEK